jgi:hypothetical protein
VAVSKVFFETATIESLPVNLVTDLYPEVRPVAEGERQGAALGVHLAEVEPADRVLAMAPIVQGVRAAHPALGVPEVKAVGPRSQPEVRSAIQMRRV